MWRYFPDLFRVQVTAALISLETIKGGNEDTAFPIPTTMSTEQRPSPPKQHLGDFAPKLVDVTDDVLFGDIWERPELSKRDRSLITCAALIATGKTEQMDLHFPRAFENGVTQEELTDAITHLAFYVDWPNAMSSINRAKALFKPAN